jgi:hypothetical protein
LFTDGLKPVPFKTWLYRLEIGLTMTGVQALTRELDDAVAALTAFDAERLETVETRIRAVTAEHLAASREFIPELRERHVQLGQLLDATAANLKVLASVFQVDARLERR